MLGLYNVKINLDFGGDSLSYICQNTKQFVSQLLGTFFIFNVPFFHGQPGYCYRYSDLLQAG
jgi:hypothetical protein